MKAVLFIIHTFAVWMVSAMDNSQGIVCQFAGYTETYGYQFNVDDLGDSLERCNIILYGQYFFDRCANKNDTKLTTQVFEADKNAIKSIVEFGRSVYIIVNYETDWALWMDLLRPTDQAYVNNQVDMLVSFLAEYKISGIVFESINIYFYTKPLTNDVITFINLIKEKLGDLKIGFSINGKDYLYFTYNQYFDFTFTNDIIDHYIIDMTRLNECSPETKTDSVNPIDSTDPKAYTIKKICVAISESDMEKSNVFASLLIGVKESGKDAVAHHDSINYESYTQLCLDAVNDTDICRWCFDSTKTLYNQGRFVADYAPNIMVSVMETDDYSGSCACHKFVGTNTIINGFQNRDQESCNTFDQLKPES